MAQILHRFGDLVTAGVENLRARRGGAPPGDPADAPSPDPATRPLDPEPGLRNRAGAGALTMADP
jgi:hypothetical protein